MLDPSAYLATLSQGGGGEDIPLYSNLKVIAVPVLATIVHTAPLICRLMYLLFRFFFCLFFLKKSLLTYFKKGL